MICKYELVAHALTIGGINHGVFWVTELSSHPQGNYIASVCAKAAKDVVTNWV